MNYSDKYRQAVIQSQAKSRWALFGLVIASLVIAKVVGNLTLGKGLAWGAVVAFLTQFVFAKISFARTRPHPKQMMSDMYLAMVGRWSVAVVGFLVGFLLLKINGIGIFVGFLAMQAINTVFLYRIRP